MPANYIRTARRSEGFTQRQLAEKMGIREQSISNWELGVSIPHYSKLKKLSEILKVPIDDLLKPTGKQIPI